MILGNKLYTIAKRSCVVNLSLDPKGRVLLLVMKFVRKKITRVSESGR